MKILLLFTATLAAVSATNFEGIVGTAPATGFIGVFAGLSYLIENGVVVGPPHCDAQIALDPNPMVFFEGTEPSLDDCLDFYQYTNLSSLYFETTVTKCTGDNVGYNYNGPAQVPGVAVSGASYYCNYFRVNGDQVELTYSNSDSPDLDCPSELLSLDTLDSAPANVAGFIIFKAIGGAQFPSCNDAASA